MEIQSIICKLNSHRQIYLLKDESGNVATGCSYEEALNYLILRRKEKKKQRNSRR